MATPSEFFCLIKAKPRAFSYTFHSELQSKKRHLPLSVFENDISSSQPVIVIEQASEVEHERKFDVYFRQTGNYFHRYVVCVDGEIRLITLMRVDKISQKALSDGAR